jgi:Uma2 family endonuclease
MVAERVHGPRWTVEQYLEMERESTVKHELIDGYVCAMAGGTRRHDRLARNVTRLLNERLEAGPCEVYTLNMRVRLASERDHVYPDASVTCDPRDLADDEPDYISYPCLVVEVLSESTEKHDRGAKFDLYRGRDTFQEYVLVETERRAVEVRTRDSAGMWTAVLCGATDDIVLASLGLTLPVAAVYRGARIE